MRVHKIVRILELLSSSFAVILLMCRFPSNGNALSSVEQHRTKSALFAKLTGPDYNKSIIPASSKCKESEEDTCPFRVQARLFPIRIQDLIESEEVMQTTLRIQLGWVDPALSWDPADYEGISSLILPGDALWVPDLQIANSVDDMYAFLSSKDFHLRVDNSGKVWWFPTGKIVTRCWLDLTYYPFDFQRCSIVLESSLYISSEIQLELRYPNEAISLGMFTQNERWRLAGAGGHPVYYQSGITTKFSRIHFWLTLKRDPSYYQQTFLIPVGLLSLIQVFTYLIPIHMVDRVAQATVVLLTAFVLESSITGQLPRSAQQCPVQTYLNILIGISVATIAICVTTAAMLEPDEGLEYWGVLRFMEFIKRRGRVISVEPASQTAAVTPTPASVGDTTKQLSKTTIVAAIFNFIGFFCSVILVLVYPTVVFVGYVSDNPPPLPTPPPNNMSLSYYAEVL